jgi:hypothetical protein
MFHQGRGNMPAWFHGINAVIATVGSIVVVLGGVVGILVSIGVIGGSPTIEATPGNQVIVPVNNASSVSNVIISNQEGDSINVDYKPTDNSHLTLTIPENAGLGDYTVTFETATGATLETKQVVIKPPQEGVTTTSNEATTTPNNVNGSFEAGRLGNTARFDEVLAGSNVLSGWTIGGDGIDYIGSLWEASDGSRSIDVNRHAEGSLSQPFPTVVGYLISAWACCHCSDVLHCHSWTLPKTSPL